MLDYSPEHSSRRWSPLLLAIVAAWAAPAQATVGDPLQTFASLDYTHYDNLFLLPDQTPGFAGPRGDNARQLSAGLDYTHAFGRQVVELRASVSRVAYEHYDTLNYSGKDFSGDLEWHLGNHLQGHAGASYVQSLTSFADYHGQERDLRLERRVYGDGEWRFHPSWRLRAAVREQAYGYELKVRSVNDRRENTFETGVDYLAPSGSAIGVLVRHVDGIYPNPSRVGTRLIQDNYGQDEIKANVDWRLSAITQATFQLGWARRQHQQASERDDSGINGRGNLSWNPTSRLRFNLTAWREFAAIESTVATSSLNKGAGLNGTYDLTSKVQMTASYRTEKRDFAKINGVPSFVGSHDSTNTAALGVSYAPLPTMRVSLNGSHNQRSGLELAGTAAYRANSMSLSVSGQF